MMTTTHLHLTTWIIGVILFLITYSFLKKGHSKAKMMQMITRVFYILIFLTGGMLITDFGLYAEKMVLGILVICLMELVLIRTAKRRSTWSAWVLFILLFAFVIYVGLSLPMGFHPFMK